MMVRVGQLTIGALLSLAVIGPPVAAASPGASAVNSRIDAAFVGHYYLSGVMETGSELLLRPDGTFEWFLAYGAEDETAHGAWHRDGNAIVLTAASPATDKPLFAYLETEPWNEQAEQVRLDRRYNDEVDKILARCPFLSADEDLVVPVVATPVNDPDPDAVPVPAGELRDRAATALRAALTARTHAETLARSAMAERGSNPIGDQEADVVRQAMSGWREARKRAWDAAGAARLPMPDLADPIMPAACTLPRRAKAAANATIGMAVRVVDPTSRQGAQNVQVTLHFADGHDASVVTAGRGVAIVPGAVLARVIGARLHADYAKGRDADFTFAPVDNGIIHFSIDAQQLEVPPFKTLRLGISGQTLVPEGAGRGRYERSR